MEAGTTARLEGRREMVGSMGTLVVSVEVEWVGHRGWGAEAWAAVRAGERIT